MEKLYILNEFENRFSSYKSIQKNIDTIPILIENIGHMGKKSGLEEIPKVIEIIKQNG